MVDFHGWLLPVQYAGILTEHRHCRRSACLFDTSHMGQIIIRTSQPALIGQVTTQFPGALAVGQARYGFLLGENGGIMDDTILMRLAEDEFLLVVNASTAESDFQWVRRHLADSVELLNQSAEGWAKVDLQGPASAKVLSAFTETDLTQLGYFRVRRAKVCGFGCILSRTGYTGELGYEIYAPGEAIQDIFSTLIGDNRVEPAGLGARDSLRLEMCYPLHGQDIGPEVNPIEADLGFFLKSKHNYIGSSAIEELSEVGPSRKLVAFVTTTRRRCEHGNDILNEGEVVGQVTSGAFSPSLNTSIGMGFVPIGLAQNGQDIVIQTSRAELRATVTEKPLYKQATCRTKEI